MHNSAVSIGKRPEYKKSRSAVWDWPRLVPIHERQSRSSEASRSSPSPSLRDHRDPEEPPAIMESTITPTSPLKVDAPLPPDFSSADSTLAAWRSVAEAIEHQPNNVPPEFFPESLPSLTDSDDEDRRAAGSGSYFVDAMAERNDPDSGHGSVEEAADKYGSGSEHGSVEDVTGTKVGGSEFDSVRDIVKRRASASERGPIGDIAQQDDIEIPVGYETSMYLVAKCEALSRCADQVHYNDQSLICRSRRKRPRRPLQQRYRL